MDPVTSIIYYSIILRYMRTLNVGVRIADTRIAAQAFADDLINLATTPRDAQRQLTALATILRKLGLRAKP